MSNTTAVAERQEARIDMMLGAEQLERRTREINAMLREINALARAVREAALRANQAETNNAA